jgi:hypothetical protein
MGQDMIKPTDLEETAEAELLFFVQIHKLQQQLDRQHIAILLQEYIFINLHRTEV